MRLFLKPCSFSKLSVLKKYDVPVVCYSSLRPSPVKDEPDFFPYTGKNPGPLKIKPKRKPFLKNLLLGVFDTEMLVYPEVLDLDRLKNIDQLSSILNRFWIEEIASNPNYFDGGIPSDYLTSITNFGLLKQKIPYSYNGLEITATESAKIIETVGKHILPATFLSNQNIIQEILSTASEDIQDHYLRSIVQNNLKGSIGLSESSSEFDIRQSKTNITYSESDGGYLLNGQKIWVTHADVADFFVVLSKLEEHGSVKPAYATVLIDKETPGLTITNHVKKGYFNLEFNNIVLKDNKFISKSKGFEIANKIQAMSQFYSASAMVGMIRDAYDQTVHFLMYRPFLDKYSLDSQATQIMLAKVASDIYALESMLYFTANLMDGYDGQDTEVEIAALKIFSSKISNNVLSECINLLGPHITMHSYQYPIIDIWKNVLTLSHLNVSDDLVKIFVAIKCIEHAKPSLTEYIKKVRNPYLYINEALKHQLFRVKNEIDNPKLDLQLELNLHPTLAPCANILEYCFKRLEYANIKLLEDLGAETYNHQYCLLRLANIIIEIYAMTSLVSRASRSYCTGIQNCDFEVRLAEIYFHENKKIVKRNVTEILDGPFGELDVVAKKVTDKTVDSKGYYAQHPLARNII